MANIYDLLIRDMNIAVLSERMRSLELSNTLNNYEILADYLDLNLSYDRIQLLGRCEKPVKELLEHLIAYKPQFTVGELLRVLQRIDRNDIVREVTNYVNDWLNRREQHQAEHHFSNDELEQQQQQRWHFHLHEANGPGENKAVLRKPGGMEIMLECLNEIMGILRVYRDALTTYHPKSQLCLWLSMLAEVAWYAAKGTFSLVHHTLCSAYGDPIDYSPWSLTFYALSFSKEFALGIMTIMGVGMLCHMDVNYLMTHVMLFCCLLILILENKTVSLDVLALRNHYSEYVLANHSHSHNKSVHEDCDRQLHSVHYRIRSKLLAFMTVEGSLLSLLIGVHIGNTTVPGSPSWNSLHFTVLAICLLELVLMIVIYCKHYFRPHWQLINGRFDISPEPEENGLP